MIPNYIKEAFGQKNTRWDAGETEEDMTERYLGLCRAAGGVVLGTESVLAEIRRGRAKLVLTASDASERTKKQLSDKCAFYQVRYAVTEWDGETLSRLLGRPCACAALTGKGPWKCVSDALMKTEECSDDRKDD